MKKGARAARPSTILFITRKFPPSIGGMENYARNLHRQFEANNTTYKISLGLSQRHLVWFIPWALIKGLIICRLRGVTHLHIGDALMSPVGIIVGRLSGVRLSVTVYGLDVIYKNPLYQRIIGLCLRGYDRIICISNATLRVCVERTIPEALCRVVPCGIDIGERRQVSREAARAGLERKLGIPSGGGMVIATIGRLVRRKGVGWFVEKVLPGLPPETTYIVAGTGPELSGLKTLVKETGMGERVLITGRISEETKRLIYDGIDLFIMPNISVGGDMEGFGIVALEAGMHGVPVVASAIEGIPDAVIDGVTGRLAPEGDVPGFINAINEAQKIDNEKIPSIISARYSWETVYNEYAGHLGL